MPKRHDPVDVVTIGVGWVGSIVAKELAQDGKQVVGLERGRERTTEDYLQVHDELRYALRYEMMQDLSKETITFRHDPGQRALPMRKYGSFLPGTGTGGAGVHWNGQTWRFLPYDFEIRSRTIDKYGSEKIPDWMPLQDWGITYKELEPYYTRFEKLAGISGKAGNIEGETQSGGNPFEGPRSSEYPTEAMMTTPAIDRFMQAAKAQSYHPFVSPSANLSEQYTNPDGVKRDPCQYCGFCERFGCEWGAKASPLVTTIPVAKSTGNFDLRTHAEVREILYDAKNERVEGVRYVDRQSGTTYIQPADVVVLSAFTLNNVRLLLLSEIGEPYDPETGEGVVGKNYCYQNSGAGAVTGFFDDEKWNLYMGAGALQGSFDDHNGDNFNHSGLDFLHGGNTTLSQTGTRPIATNPIPSDTPSWGSEFKDQSLEHNYSTLSISTQGAQLPHRRNYLSLDPEYTDEHGQPLLRITFNWTPNDRKMMPYMAKRNRKVMEEMGASTIETTTEKDDYSIVPYQSTHNVGGAIMGADRETSVVNTYLQHWDAPNLFVPGASAFPHNSGYNPTGTVGALSFRAVDGIRQHLKRGGLV